MQLGSYRLIELVSSPRCLQLLRRQAAESVGRSDKSRSNNRPLSIRFSRL
jgi:hypothetical protein